MNKAERVAVRAMCFALTCSRHNDKIFVVVSVKRLYTLYAQKICAEMVISMNRGISNAGENYNAAICEAVNPKEVYRYLGYRGEIPDETVCSLIETVLTQLRQDMEPKSIYKIYDCCVEEDVIRLSQAEHESVGMMVHSKNLADNLQQCRKTALLAATLGIGADKLLRKYEVTNMAKASIAQACGAACIEAYCNILQEDIRKQALIHPQMDGKRLYLRPRFSPGYGDLPLETQKAIFDQLECSKRIGLTLTQSLLMVPTKSVTAFIGMTEREESCHIGKCEYCGKADCSFREI